MAKKPTTEHGKALSAFNQGWITRDEYQAVCVGYSFIYGGKFWDGSGGGWGWETRPLRPKP